LITCYLAAYGFASELLQELHRLAVPVREARQRLAITEAPPASVYWVQNVWRECRPYRFQSISEAAHILRGLQRNWAKYSIRLHRRAELIQEQLPRYSARPLKPLGPLPAAPMGGWTLLDRNTLLASSSCSSPFPNGQVQLEEDKSGPPSRAYLKLWELFTVHGLGPRRGELCLDLGSSPGSWSWALQRLGCRVISVDKAPLHAAVARLPGLSVRKQSAFALKPEEVGPVDWLFSDVICYPQRLYDLVQRWLASGLARNLVCTIKFQGPTDHEAVRRFAAIPGSSVVHLYHNRHELTWYRLGR
jgi:23S rRNA (cytidine2498-2'-O)-methyltransferase